MKDDLISRSALIEALELAKTYQPVNPVALDLTISVTKAAPAVDAETVIKSLPYVKEALEMAKQNLAPVRHGRWIEKPFLLGTSNFCSCVIVFMVCHTGNTTTAPTAERRWMEAVSNE